MTIPEYDICQCGKRGPHAECSAAVETHPVQTPQGKRLQGKAPKTVTMAAYEVYCHVYGPQEAMVTGWCRGGFSTGELISFLYARSFPKEQWGRRVNEAFLGAENL